MKRDGRAKRKSRAKSATGSDAPGRVSEAAATSGGADDLGTDGTVAGRDDAEGGIDPEEQTAADVIETAEVELLSDAELVHRMLRAESGRMRQSDIVEATGWSKAKVSRRLSAMADEDELTKVQIGRENLICLDGAVPDPAVSREVPSGKTGGLGATPTG